MALTLSDRSHLQATVQNGWFVAWWPGSASVASAAVNTSRGTITQAFAVPPAPPCPPGATCSSGSGAGGKRGEPVMSVGGN